MSQSLEEREMQQSDTEDESKWPEITVRQALDDLKAFAEDFSHFDFEVSPEEISNEELSKFAHLNLIKTPQADFGIGPVRYDIEFDPEKQIDQSILELLSEVVDLERENGNRLLKTLSTISCIQFGNEDPFSWMPTVERQALRIRLQETTSRFIDESNLTQSRESPWENVEGLLRECEKECLKQGRYPSGAEIALIADYKTVGGLAMGEPLDADDEEIFENFYAVRAELNRRVDKRKPVAMLMELMDCLAEKRRILSE